MGFGVLMIVIIFSDICSLMLKSNEIAVQDIGNNSLLSIIESNMVSR